MKKLRNFYFKINFYMINNKLKNFYCLAVKPYPITIGKNKIQSGYENTFYRN